MRKRNKKGKIFSRPKNQRVALFKTLANSLFLHNKIQTTEAKAKELRMVAEKLITRAKSESVANRRVLAQGLPPKTVIKLINEIAPRYSERKGGYTRITKVVSRKSDGARLAIIELL